MAKRTPISIADVASNANDPGHAVAREGAVTVHVPIGFRRRGGRKTLTAPDGSPAFMPVCRHVDSVLIKALARAFRWRKLIETGIHASIQDIATAERINPSYVSRVLRLTLLAPDLVEALLDGRQEPRLALDAAMRPFHVVWAKQMFPSGANRGHRSRSNNRRRLSLHA